jgi:hypothetical protein
MGTVGAKHFKKWQEYLGIIEMLCPFLDGIATSLWNIPLGGQGKAFDRKG